MSNLEIVKTEDGSQTLYSNVFNEHYHSIHGAKNETNKIFIEYALMKMIKEYSRDSINIFEVGFGTGLNAIITKEIADKEKIKINYSSIELYPIDESIYLSMSNDLEHDDKENFLKIHRCEWNKRIELSEFFSLKKIESSLLDYDFSEDNLIKNNIDIVYFDAFSPETQSEMWSEDVFRNLYQNMKNNSILSTYCAKGVIRRRLESIGFIVDRLAGPSHKREVLRANKV